MLAFNMVLCSLSITIGQNKVLYLHVVFKMDEVLKSQIGIGRTVAKLIKYCIEM